MSEKTQAVFRICEALRAAVSDLRGNDAWDAAIRKQVKRDRPTAVSHSESSCRRSGHLRFMPASME